MHLVRVPNSGTEVQTGTSMYNVFRDEPIIGKLSGILRRMSRSSRNMFYSTDPPMSELSHRAVFEDPRSYSVLARGTKATSEGASTWQSTPLNPMTPPDALRCLKLNRDDWNLLHRTLRLTSTDADITRHVVISDGYWAGVLYRHHYPALINT